MAELLEEVLGYCSDCGEPSFQLIVVEAEDENNSMAFCPECMDEFVSKVTDKYISFWSRRVGEMEFTEQEIQEVKELAKMAVHFSSKTDMWATPQDFFNELNEEFNFELDVCALPENAKCEKYFTPEMDGLEQEWTGVCWMNPPYGRVIGKWVKKAYESSLKGATVVCLLPSRTDTKWFQDYCMKGEMRFIRGRLKFGNSKNPAQFPSVVVVFKDDYSY